MRSRRRRYHVVRGAYSGTNDDRIDRWYIAAAAVDVVDRRGPGYIALREAQADADVEEYLTGTWSNEWGLWPQRQGEA